MAKDINELLNTDVEAIVAEGQKGFKRTQKKAILAIIIFIALCAIAAGAYLIVQQVQKESRYSYAVELLEAEKYSEAIKSFEDLGDFRDSIVQTQESHYRLGNQHMSKQEYDAAIKEYECIKDYKDSNDLKTEATYKRANEYMDSGEYEKAAGLFYSLGDYENSSHLREIAHAKESPYDAIGNYLFTHGECVIVNDEYFDDSIQLLSMTDEDTITSVYGLTESHESDAVKATSSLYAVIPNYRETQGEYDRLIYTETHEQSNGSVLYYEADIRKNGQMVLRFVTPFTFDGKKTKYFTVIGHIDMETFTKESEVNLLDYDMSLFTVEDAEDSKYYQMTKNSSHSGEWDASFSKNMSTSANIILSNLPIWLDKMNLGITLSDIGFTDY